MPKQQPTIKVILDMDNTLVHSFELPATHLKDCHTVIEERTNGGLFISMLRPSAEQFLKQLSAKGYTLCIMTSGTRDLQEKILDKLGIREFFQEIYCGENLESTLNINADAFVLVDDLDITLGAGQKLEVLGVPEVAELRRKMQSLENAEERKSAEQRLPLATAPYFVKCLGWTGGYTDEYTDVKPLTDLVSQIEAKIGQQLRTAYCYVSLIPGRIPHVANQDERYDVAGDTKIEQTTKQLEAFHPSFTVVSKGEFSALTVQGSVLMLNHLFPNMVLSEKYKALFPYIREVTQM